MLTRHKALIAMALVGILSTACASTSGLEKNPDVVALVDKTPITVATVKSLMTRPVGGAPVQVAGAPPTDPRKEALDQAIRDELFAREARRLGLTPSPAPGTAQRAVSIRAFIERARNTYHLNPSDVDEARARTWYSERKHLFDHVQTMDLTWAKVSNADRAKELLDKGASLDRTAFGTLLAQYGSNGVQEKGSATVGPEDPGVDAFVRRIGLALREPGKVGMVLGDNNVWWIARLNDISFAEAKWDETLAHRVKTAVAWEAEQQKFDQISSELRRRWPVTIFEDRLSAIEVG